MKKICSFLLVLLTLCGMLSTVAFADFDSDLGMVQADLQQAAGEFGTAQTAPNITYENNVLKLEIDPAPAVKAWMDLVPTWKSKIPNADFFVYYRIDFKFNDGQWFSEAYEQSLPDYDSNDKNDIRNPINAGPFITQMEVQSAQPIVIEFANLNNDYDTQDVWEDITNVIESNGTNGQSIDFTKHTLYVKVTPVFRFSTEEGESNWAHANVLECAFHNGKMEIQNELSAPNVSQAVFNLADQTMVIYLDFDAHIESLLKTGQHVNANVIFYINDKTVEFTTEITDTRQILAFAAHDFPEDITAEDNFIVGITYRIAETGESTPENRFVPNVEWEHNEDLLPDDVVMNDERCAICKKCSNPANICIYMWISWGVSLVGIITAVIILIKRRKDTKHE